MRHIQVDEPLFALTDDEEMGWAVEAINMATEGLRHAAVHQHVCQGNYAVGPEYDGQISDTGISRAATRPRRSRNRNRR
ncbi:MAG: hypothetical protein ABIV11_08695 [Gemmatimonadaceae bacterium]